MLVLTLNIEQNIYVYHSMLAVVYKKVHRFK